ncbi:hypothetical protein ACFUJR_06960 [Streptomyces sp. NPDC057271]|uniref:hypothetical protein n=1 Tax=unclassified Streptomyces TaxID=2593676 RepID=UPI0036264A77
MSPTETADEGGHRRSGPLTPGCVVRPAVPGLVARASVPGEACGRHAANRRRS